MIGLVGWNMGSAILGLILSCVLSANQTQMIIALVLLYDRSMTDCMAGLHDKFAVLSQQSCCGTHVQIDKQ